MWKREREKMKERSSTTTQGFPNELFCLPSSGVLPELLRLEIVSARLFLASPLQPAVVQWRDGCTVTVNASRIYMNSCLMCWYLAGGGQSSGQLKKTSPAAGFIFAQENLISLANRGRFITCDIKPSICFCCTSLPCVGMSQPLWGDWEICVALGLIHVWRHECM